VACGAGRLLHFFKKQGYSRFSGVDISPAQVNLARQIIPGVLEGDVIEFLEAHREEFDLIAGLDIVEHFHKPEVLRFLDACHAALRPGGRLILQTPNADSPWSAGMRYGDFTHEVIVTPSAISRLLHMTGFTETEAREMGPVPFGYSVVSTLRYLVWQTIRVALKVWNVAETGNAGSGVLTRVFLISGIKK
jgi:cyclopropane fatty-acyl-phospholipid synthase-like methyltransferase